MQKVAKEREGSATPRDFPGAPVGLAAGDGQNTVEGFLLHEAELLDDRRFDDWLDLVTDDIDYRIPIRVELDDDGDPFSASGYYLQENHASLRTRIDRLKTDSAWCERPHPRVRHHISNIRTGELQGNEISARSNLLFFWARGDAQTVVSGERRDVLRIVDNELRLAKRVVLLDHTFLPLLTVSPVL